jgi:anti-sigma factor RsiW
MKTETLESLLIDRALGALSPEAAELLEDYLIQNREAACVAASLASTVDLARGAVALPMASVNHLPSWNRVRKALGVQRRQTLTWELGKLAACVLLGLAVGLAPRFGGRPAVPPTELAVAPGPSVANKTGAVTAGQNGIWSLANFTPGKSEHAADGVTRYRLQWDSPTKIPHLEGNL